jgi:hypothetical protein
LNRTVVADPTVLKRFVASRAVLLPKERPKERAIDLAQALGGGGLVRICRWDLPQRHDRGGKGRSFGRGVRIASDVQGCRTLASAEIIKGHGYPAHVLDASARPKADSHSAKRHFLVHVCGNGMADFSYRNAAAKAGLPLRIQDCRIIAVAKACVSGLFDARGLS